MCGRVQDRDGQLPVPHTARHVQFAHLAARKFEGSLPGRSGTKLLRLIVNIIWILFCKFGNFSKAHFLLDNFFLHLHFTFKTIK